MPYTKDIDHLYWQRFTGGDKSAYTALYRFYYPRLYNYGMKLCQDAARTEDCIQDLMSRIWFKRAVLQGIENPGSYLFVAFRHQLVKAPAGPSPAIGCTGEEGAFPLEVAADEQLIDHEQTTTRRDYLQKALDTLTPRQREAVFLKFYEQMSYEEISALLEISTKATYKLIGRAIAELRAFSVRHPALDMLLSVGWVYLIIQSFFPA